jgi:hypothetical protein
VKYVGNMASVHPEQSYSKNVQPSKTCSYSPLGEINIVVEWFSHPKTSTSINQIDDCEDGEDP